MTRRSLTGQSLTRQRVLQAVSALSLTLLLSLPLLAQSRAEKREEANSRSAVGTVMGPDDAPSVGAVVQLKDMRTLQVRSYITQGDGAYHFSGLKADVDYQLTAKSGDLVAGPKNLSIFDNRKEAVINFKLEKK